MINNPLNSVINNAKRRRFIKRGLALLCALVLVFTMNTLKRDANTLERIPMCGYAEEHVHTPDCYDGDALACGLAEHIHTDACYQEWPDSADDMNVQLADAPVVDPDMEDVDLSLSLSEDDFTLVSDDVAPAQVASNDAGRQPKAFILGEGAMVSQIIDTLGLGVGLDGIIEAAVVENDPAQVNVIGIEKIGSDYRIWALQDFARAQLALVVEGDILLVDLLDGVAVREDTEDETAAEAEPAREDIRPVVEDSPVDEAAEGQIEAVPAPEAGAEVAGEQPDMDGQTEVGILLEDEAPVEAEAPVEDADAPVGDGQGEEAPAPSRDAEPADIEAAEPDAQAEEEAEPAEDGETVEEEAAPVEDEETTEEEAESAEGEEAVKEEAEPAEDGDTAEEEATPAEGEETTEEEPTEVEEQPAEDETEIDGDPVDMEEAVEAPDESDESSESGEAPAGEPADGRQAACVATFDLAGVSDYPLSLNALLAEAAPVADGEAGAIPGAEEAGEEAPAEAPVIEYDHELLDIKASGDDHLITPVASFESTVITVDNGSRYALTLVNFALPEVEDAAEAEPLPEYPAQDFEGRTRYVKVVVSAPEGAFPAGTMMAVADVEDEKTLTDIEDTVSEAFVEVKRVHAVDITFTDAKGNEIEPLAPISVVMTVDEIEQRQEAVVVHVDDDGATEVVQSQSEAPEGETGVKVEMPAGEAPAGDESAVGFEADSFSVYAVVITETIDTKYIDAEGATWNISVGYGPEAGIPEGARLAVQEVEGDYLEQTAELLKGRETITLARFFDITILDAEGNEVQPARPVEVKAALAEQSEDAVKAVHFAEEGPEILEASQDEDAVSFDAASFSVYGIVYTVDFHFGVDGETYEFTLPGGGAVGMRELAPALGLVEDTEDAVDLFARSIENVAFSDESLVKALPVNISMTVGALKELYELESEYSAELTEAQIAELNDKVLQAPDWALVSLKPFDTEETLTVALATGETFTVAVTDAQLSQTVITASGEAYVITVTYGENAAIPEGAELKVREILPGDEAYAGYLAQAKKAASGEADADETKGEEAAEDEIAEANGEGDYARFFDIEIWADDQKVEPAAPVTVDIALADAPQNGEALKVVHFDEADGPVVMQTEIGEEGEDEAVAEAAKVRFETDGFSVYAVLTYKSTTNVGANDLAGRWCTIKCKNDYLTANSQNYNGFDRLENSTNANDAAIWHFESAGQDGQYYIYTIVNNERKYMKFEQGYTGTDNNYRAHVRLGNDPMAISVKMANNYYILSVTLPNYENGTKDVYLNEIAGTNGFGGYGSDSEQATYHLMNFDFKDISETGNDDNKYYALVAKKKGTDECYSVNHDGSLQAVEFNSATSTVTLGDPMLWAYTKDKNDSSKTYIRHRIDGYNFDDYTQLAGSFIHGYIDPTAAKGVSYDVIEGWYTPANSSMKEPTGFTLVNKDNVNLVLDDQQHIYNLQNGSYKFLAIKENAGGKPELVGGYAPDGAQLDAINGWEFYLAEVQTVSGGGDWTRNTVNHIDIGVKGGAYATVPIPYGRYMNAAGEIVNITTNKRVMLETTDVDVTEADIKKGTVTAFKKNGDVIVPQNDVFYITGYSANRESGKSRDQVRIEGSFLVAQGDDLTALMTNNGAIDVGQYNQNVNEWEYNEYRQQVYTARLKPANRIYYTVTIAKTVDFVLKSQNKIDKNDTNDYTLYKVNDDGTPVLDAEGKKVPATISLDVTLSASFDYWDPRNECPPITQNKYWDKKNDQGKYEGLWYDGGWEKGEIWQLNGSGMDFILGGGTEGGRVSYALQVTKQIEDENGIPIKLDPDLYIVNTYDILKNSTASPHSVMGLNVGEYEHEADYNGYTRIDTQSTVIGSNGIGMLYAFDQTNGMYAIQEHTDEGSLPRTITDANGETWTYKETYIETEYEKRGDKYDAEEDPMHVSKVYNDPTTADTEEERGAMNEYRSVPEVLGPYKTVTNEDKTSEYLQFFVHNVYVPTKTSLTVKKNWGGDSAPEGSYVDVVLKRYKLINEQGSYTPPEPETATLVIHDNYEGLPGNLSYYATYRVKGIDSGNSSYDQTFNWLNGDIEINDLPLGNYMVTKTATAHDGFNMDHGSQEKTARVRATGGRVVFDNTDYTPQESGLYHRVIVKSADTLNTNPEGYVWIDTTYQRGSPLKFTVGASLGHQYMSGNHQYYFRINGGEAVQMPYGQMISRNFVLTGDTTIIIYGETPYYNGYLISDPSVVMDSANEGNASNAVSNRSLASNSRKAAAGMRNLTSNSNSPIYRTNTGKLPEISGSRWQLDSTWYDDQEREGRTVRLDADNGWQASVDELEKRDAYGNVYVYFIDSVTEYGMPSGTTAVIDVDAGNTKMLVYGDRENESADRPNSQLSLTNTLPKTTDINILKVDSVTNGSLNAVFSLYKYSDAEFQNQDGSAQSVTVNGNATISGLGVGYYRLVETQWPSGYVQTSANLRFRVYIDSSTKEVMVQYIGDDNNTVSYDPASKTFTVRNTPKGALKITKVVQVNDAVPTSDAHKALTNGTYTFSVTNAAGIEIAGSPFSITYSNGAVTEPAADYVLVDDLDPGVYTITETGSDNPLMRFKSVTGGNNDANAANKRITVTVVAGDNTASNASAQVEYTNNRDVVDIDATKTWTNNGTDVTAQLKNASVTFTLQSRSQTGENAWTGWATVAVTAAANGNDAAVELKTEGTASSNLSAWKVSWNNLPKYDEQNRLIQYQVVESQPKVGTDAIQLPTQASAVADNYSAVDGHDNPTAKVGLTNPLPTTEVTVKKTWSQSTNWPDAHIQVGMTLKADGNVANNLPGYTTTVQDNGEDKQVVVDSQNALVWLTSANATDGHTWHNLPVYTNAGEKIVYSVEETGMMYKPDSAGAIALGDSWKAAFTTNPSSYTGNPDGNGTVTIDNTPKTTEIKVTKVWTLNGADKGFNKATEISYELHKASADGALAVDAANITADKGGVEAGKVRYVTGENAGWQTVTISRLPKYELVIDTESGTATATYSPVNYYVTETGVTGDTRVTYKANNGEEKETASEANTNDGTITIYNRDALVDINVLKVDATNASKKLKDAEFQILKYKDDSEQYVAYDFVHKAFVATVSGDASTQNAGDSSKQKTNANGTLSFTGLPAGQYKLVETKTPDGYIKVENNDIYFTVSADGTVKWTKADGTEITETTETGKLSQVGYTSTNNTFTVGNNPGAKLPSTGGSGTTPYYVFGSLLALIAVALLVARRRGRA